MRRAEARLAVVVWALFAMSCSDRKQDSANHSAATLADPASFDLSAVMTRVHYAFRAEDGGFSGGHSSYRVQVSADGSAVVTPHSPAGEAAPGARATHGLYASSLSASRTSNAAKGRAGAPARIQTVAIARAGATLQGGSGVASLANDGVVVITRGDVMERLENTDEGVEQSWTFLAPPAGSGDMTVRVKLTGLVPAGATELGLHFSDPMTGLGLRYGKASWIDGLGQVAELSARLDGNEIVITVPEELVQNSAFPAVLDPVIGPEIGMDVPVSTRAWSSREDPAVAFDGTNYLVAWSDHRYAGSTLIYGARVARDGTVVDPSGIPISAVTDVSAGPAIAFDGTNYVVVWGGAGVRATRVSTGGAVLDPSGIVISSAGSAPAVAFDGTNHLVVWADAGIKGARLSTAGALVDGQIAISSGDASNPAIAFDGTSYLVVWSDGRRPGEPLSYRDIYGARVDKSGTVLDPAGVAISAAASSGQPLRDPAVAFDGGNFAVVWSIGYDAGIHGARVARDSTVLDRTGIAISSSGGSSPAVAFDGTSYLVAWAGGGIRGSRMRPDGTVLDPASIAISTAASSTPALASGGASSLVVWKNDGSSSSDIVGARVGKDGAVVDPGGQLISRSANAQFSHAVAFDGTNYLVVWQDFRGTYYDIYAVMVAGDGTVLDPSGIAISTAANDKFSPVVAFGGSNYLVAWNDQRTDAGDIYGARVGTDGTVLDPAGIAISAAPGVQTSPYVAFDGANYLALWDDGRGSPGTYGARIASDGAVLDPNGIAISERRSVSGLAFDGTNYLALWAGGGVYGARIGKDGTVLDPAGKTIATGGGYPAALAFDGTNFLVVWPEFRSGTSYDVYGARVGKDGAVLDGAGIPISAAAGNQLAPAVAFDGVNYLVAWQDDRSGAGIQLYGRGISQAGAVVEAADVSLVGETTLNNIGPAIAASGDGSLLLVYDRFDPSVPYGSYRVRGRIIKTGTGARLTLTRTGDGSGRVTSSPAGIDCGAACSAAFDPSTVVALTAVVDPGSQFGGWSGDCSGSGTTCTVTMDAAKSVTAQFAKDQLGEAPVLKRVSPRAGPAAGGAGVMLSGANFQASAAVLFGGIAARSVTISGSTIIALTPAHQAGAVDVTVTNPDGQSAILAGAYAYLPAHRLAGATPADGAASEGTP
jgi:hypothetical protein